MTSIKNVSEISPEAVHFSQIPVKSNCAIENYYNDNSTTIFYKYSQSEAFVIDSPFPERFGKKEYINPNTVCNQSWGLANQIKRLGF
ncbi:MAG: hypothetical protein ACRCU2_11245 [Planktothrix sp.]